MMRVEVRGTEDVKRLLEEVAPRHAVNISRATVHGVAGSVRDLVKRNAPRDEGDLARSIKTKRRRMEFGRIRSDVVAERGRGAKADGFYWRFLERGTSKLSARPFILPSVREIEAKLPVILREQFVKKFQAAIRRAQKRGR
ncbi:HK97-gp10 family putative phage morphogenesis protein [Rhodovulum marinum]|uniref:HK97 gp10 family phage protein n=1 Tax=Rhodovulum marinum TaxID=320662 RepID=A0A4R2QAT6_9RHOB|nr:HK97-gp10 family putative phage morphogenesis protein [Rhodovulum marinum]TCP43935.1 HK97 gp10 family phage protein [Rhodovulum marinum]